MDPGEGSDHRLSENQTTYEDRQAREKAQGKKYRHNIGDNNPVQGAVSRPKQRAPGNLTTNGICPNSAEPKFNNNNSAPCGKGDLADPYSVSYNVDSKNTIDKCSKTERAEREYPGCCSWGLQGLLPDVKINNTDSGSLKLNNCDSNHKSESSENNPQNGSCPNVNANQSDFNINVPSTSSSSRPGPSATSAGNSGGSRGSRKRSAQSSRVLPAAPAEDSSSDTGNDDYSVGSDECCIYTYRGGEHLADLPSSFFSLDMGLAEAGLPAAARYAARPPPSRNSSPDMDYLEMDFDPGPSCEADSDRESSLDLDLDATQPDDNINENNSIPATNPIDIEVANSPENHAPSPGVARTLRETSPGSSPVEAEVPAPVPRVEWSVSASVGCSSSSGDSPQPSTSGLCRLQERQPAPALTPTPAMPECPPVGGLIQHTLACGKVVCVRRTCRSWATREGPAHHSSSGDLISPGDTDQCVLPEALVWAQGAEPTLLESRHNLASALFHCTMAKRLTVHRTDNFLHDQDTSNEDGGSVERPMAVAKCMVWSEQEACSRQVTQICTSACGATAVINALLGLNQPVELERVLSAVGTRARAPTAPLPRYLAARALAGCGTAALAAGLRTQHVHCRHFATWPERALSLSHWLAYWIGLGAVPIMTLNLQAGAAEPPDSWHHQMVFGVGPRGVYLTNPLECVEEGALWHHLCSDSILLIRRKDIISRWTAGTDLSPLLNVPGDSRWRTMNVLGQVVNVIRESQGSTGSTWTSHIRIPACYEAGISIAAVFGSEAHRRLLSAPELPLLHPPAPAL